MKRGVFLPPFGELADPRVLAELAARAEAAGWDGAFLWDHVTYRDPVVQVLDPWIAMAAMAMSTERILLGPMVTPLPRRRVQVVARQTVALDLLSNGRLVLGVGIGLDSSGRELSAFGEELDAKARGDMLDEQLEALVALWSGERVEHPLANDVAFHPVPVQHPRIPIWCAARWPNPRPLRRALRYEGVFIIDLDDPGRLGLGDLPAGFDVVVEGPPGDDVAAWEAAGATWHLLQLDPFDVQRARVESLIDAGPA